MSISQIIFDTEAVRVTYNVKEEWMFLEWFGQPPEATRIQALEIALQFAKAHKCTKVISDLSQRTGIWADSADWLNTWMPRVEEAGIRNIAIVYSEEQFSRLSTDLVINMYKGPVAIMAFHNLESAEKWLRSV